MTQQEFADYLGVTKPTVGRWEIDMVKPSPLAMRRLRETASQLAPEMKWLPEQDSNLQPSG